MNSSQPNINLPELGLEIYSSEQSLRYLASLENAKGTTEGIVRAISLNVAAEHLRKALLAMAGKATEEASETYLAG